MRSENMAILFYLKKSKVDKNGFAPIYVRITIGGKRAEVSCGRKCLESEWDIRKGRVKGNSEKARTVNVQLDMMLADIRDSEYEVKKSAKSFTAKNVKSNLLGIESKEHTLEKAIVHTLNIVKEGIGSDYVYETYKKYITSTNHIRKFVSESNYNKDVLVKELKSGFIAEFFNYLTIEKGISRNSAIKHTIHLKKIVNNVVELNWIEYNPFTNFSKKKDRIMKEYLTEGELNRLLIKDFGIDRLNKVKDIFLFCCFTGLAYCDVLKLKIKELVEDDNGNKWIDTFRKKNGNRCRIPLLRCAEEIANKYKKENQNEDELILPVISSQKMNGYLKEIATICGIKKNCSMHLARHTYGTYLLTIGTPIETVQQFMGHDSIKSTLIYAKLVKSKVEKDALLVRQKTAHLQVS